MTDTIAVMEKQKVGRKVDYDALPDPKTDTCKTCHWGAPRNGDNSTTYCHYVPGCNPASAQRDAGWWCSAHVPKKKVMKEVEE